MKSVKRRADFQRRGDRLNLPSFRVSPAALTEIPRSSSSREVSRARAVDQNVAKVCAFTTEEKIAARTVAPSEPKQLSQTLGGSDQICIIPRDANANSVLSNEPIGNSRIHGFIPPENRTIAFHHAAAQDNDLRHKHRHRVPAMPRPRSRGFHFDRAHPESSTFCSQIRKFSFCCGRAHRE